MKARIIVAASFLLWFFLPSFALAHATPIEYIPEASVILERLPETVVIRFTERIEPGASSILLYGPDGTPLATNEARVRPTDSHYYEVAMPPGTQGTYAVSWQVVSADDGHFTKGAFTFSLQQEGGVNLVSTQQQLQIMHASPQEEIIAVWVEHIGQALFVGALAFLLLLLRPFRKRISSGKEPAFTTVISKGLTLLFVIGALLIAGGTILYIGIKTLALADVQAINVQTALSSFMTTVAGKSALARGLLALVVLGIFLGGRHRIITHPRITFWETGLLLAVFAISVLRVVSSHAAAAPVFPLFSQVDHFFHTLAKNLWAGMLLVSGLTLYPILRTLKEQVTTRFAVFSVARILAVAITVALVTGVYVVWLDLKDFSNIFTSDWGKRFLFFSALIGPLVALRLSHVLLAERPSRVSHFYSATFLMEMLFGIALLYGTAASMSTTPPTPLPQLFSRQIASGQQLLTFEEHPYEKNAFRITLDDAEGNALPVSRLTLTLFQEERSIGPIVAPVGRRSDNSFTLSKSLFAPPGRWRIDISASQPHTYDAVGTLTVRYPEEIGTAQESVPSWNTFTTVMALGALLNLLFGIALFALTLRNRPKPSSPSLSFSLPRSSLFVTTSFFLAYVVFSYGVVLNFLISPFEKMCGTNGDFWHVMTPMRDGKIISQHAFAGCMTADSQFHFADQKEYAYFNRDMKPKAALMSDSQTFHAGAPSTLTFAIHDSQGNPVSLAVNHERLLHVIVISDDFTVFSHIHPDDAAPLSEGAKANAQFSVPYTFSKGGSYLVALDYQVGRHHYSDHFTFQVAGQPATVKTLPDFRQLQEVDGHLVQLDLQPASPRAQENITLTYTFKEAGGTPITTLQPYLAAAMHLAVVREDFGKFIHAHGEIHTPGQPQPSGGMHMHTALLPHSFGPQVEAHLVFPAPGVYHLFGEFAHEGKIRASHFSVKVK